MDATKTGSPAGTERSDNEEQRRLAFKAIEKEFKPTHDSQSKYMHFQ